MVKHSQYALASSVSLFITALWWLLPHPLLPVVLPLLPVAAILVLALPFQVVLLFVIFSFFRLHEVFPALYSLKIPLLLSLASLAALSWHIAISGKIRPWWRKELTCIGLFFLLVLIGVLLASNRPVALAYFQGVYWKIALMTFALAWLTRSEKDFSFASLAITIAGGIVATAALYNKIHGIDLVEGTRVTIGRALGSVLGDPNDLALVLMFPAAFALSLAITPGIGALQRTLGTVSVPLLFFAVIATQSRGGLLGILAVFAVFAYRRIRNKLLFAALAALGAIVIYLLAGIAGRASGGSSEAGLDASAKGRLYAWEAAYKMALDHPFTGVGLDNFYANYFYYSPHWDGLNHAVHSTWFGILAETGFLGLFCFIGLMVVLFKAAGNNIRQLSARSPGHMLACAHAVYAGLLGTVVSGTFLTQGFTWPIYIQAALIIALARQISLQKAN
ncbi:O-antigen ligase family protein [Thalassomonas viridans]|uniref:O-antigen ligase family protein n=1 Tax=Thalassomonas viridans TaxID=137584 RepID=A0AAF0C6T1_9GAMM|nr:O-antigen ligase family protein [Thalassomonas viridans]WDE02998.1 O-antigen ligase family protein [Thalassomonas viridans]